MGKMVRVDQAAPSEEAMSLASKVLLGGGVLVMPTDSVYGIGCAATPGNPGHERIFGIKRRDRAQTLPWLVADVADLERYGANVPRWAVAVAGKLWPGALTLVVKASREVPGEYARAGDGTIALRCPASNLVRGLARRCAVPLATTSANTHGADPAVTGLGVESRLVSEADLTLDGGPAPLAVPSTIVDCTRAEPAFLRVGAIDPAEILLIANLSS